MRMLAITLRQLQQKLHDAGMGNESALVARMARDAETISHINIADIMGYNEPQVVPADAGWDGAQASVNDAEPHEGGENVS